MVIQRVTVKSKAANGGNLTPILPPPGGKPKAGTYDWTIQNLSGADIELFSDKNGNFGEGEPLKVGWESEFTGRAQEQLYACTEAGEAIVVISGSQVA